MLKPMCAAALVLALAGCDQPDRENRVVPAVKAAAEAPPEDRIACAVAGKAGQCVVDTAQSERGLIVTVNHPDGGFRRLLVTKDGRGVVAADGSQPASVKIVGAQELEVTIAGDRYRLPATVRPQS